MLLGLQHHLDVNWQNDVLTADSTIAAARSGDATHQGIGLLLGACGAYLLFRHRRGFRLRRGIGTVFACFLTWTALTVFWADDPIVTVRRQIGFAAILSFAAGCNALMDSEALPAFLAIVAVLNLGAGCIHELLRGNIGLLAENGRFGGTVDPNVQGATLALTVILLFWWMRKPGRARWIAAAALPVLVGFTLLTRSRTSLLSAVAAVVCFWILFLVRSSYRANPQRSVAVLILVTLVMITGGLAIRSYNGDLLGKLREDRDEGEVSELTGRTLIWERCLSEVESRPLLGFGYGGFWTAERVATVSDDLKWPVAHAHSAYLDQALTLGIPGAFLYVLLLLMSLVVSIRRFWRGQDIAAVWAGVMLFFIIHGTTESISVIQTFPAFALLLIFVHLTSQPESSDRASQLEVCVQYRSPVMP
jgi:O-antigen ligase